MATNCPGCSAEMTSMTLDAHLSSPMVIDLCAACQALWFDKYESLKLSPSSTLKLMKFIGEHSGSIATPPSNTAKCPRCSSTLLQTHDMQRSTRFIYWRCGNDHGKFIRFFEFLKEKNFVRPLTPEQITELRQNIQTLNCSSCGAPIDLAASSVCSHCGSPVSMLDMNQPQKMLAELQKAAEPRPVDPALPYELAMAKRDMERSFGPDVSGSQWWSDTSSSGLVHAGLTAVAKWLSDSGI